jgi:uncharacterized membrane protein YgcG
MPSRTRTTARRPASLAAVLTAVLAGLLLSLIAALPTAATPPFALPDQITDEAGAVEGHTAEIQAALDDLEAEHGVRMWVVFVDTFDGTDPQAGDQTYPAIGLFGTATGEAWAYETFAATGLGVEDCLLAVAMTDREYAYAIPQGFPALEAALPEGGVAAAMTRVARATERHLTLNPARAVITAASTMGQELVGRPSYAPKTFAVLAGLFAMAGLIIFLHVRSQRKGPEPDHGSEDTYSGSSFTSFPSNNWRSGGSSGGGGAGGTREGSGSS